MPTPIPFSVSAAVRSNTFQSATLTMPSGYTALFWELNIPNQSEYEDTGNSFTATIMYDPAGGTDFTIYGQATWVGGPATNKAGDVDPPPAIQFDVTPIPVGAKVFVKLALGKSMTIGIQNGLLS